MGLGHDREVLVKPTLINWENVDANKVKLVLPLKAREKRLFTYGLNTNSGSNATR